MIIPSIDLMNGKAVRMRNGKKVIRQLGDPVDLARKLSVYPELQIIDLDAAMGRGNNLQTVKKICKIAPCRVGGGIRTIEYASELLKAGAAKLIISTMATKAFLQQLPKGKVIVALDAKGRGTAIRGWRGTRSKSPAEVCRELSDYCSGFLITSTENDGTMKGVDAGLIKSVKRCTSNRLAYAGGISCYDDVLLVDSFGLDSVLGLAMDLGKVKPEEAFAELFKDELVPTVVQDEKGQVLMLAYSNRQSILKSLATRKATYFSRSRNKLWVKGETSGNTQKLIRAYSDCDNDSILYIVRQKGNACHEDRYSCFKEKEFSMESLQELLISRIRKPVKGSYTSSLTLRKAKRKLIEEAYELVDAQTRSETIWESADLLYFTLVLLSMRSVKLKEVMRELIAR